MRSAVLNEYRLNGFTVYENAHIGSGALFFGPNVPSGWMPCDGRALSRADYAKLFAEIGTYWGSGDGSTTFNIPDLRDRVPQGADASSLGDYIEAGLPNITGDSGAYLRNQYSSSPTGAFSFGDSNSLGTGASNTDWRKLKFDASQSSQIYKDDCDTVQPPAAACYIIIKVTNAGNSGGGSALVPDMTEAEYNALSPEEQNNGQIRHITDAEETPVPFAVVNDTLTTSANVWTAQKTKNEIDNAFSKTAENNIYSDEEVIIGYLILNGVKKPIYRKVLNITTPVVLDQVIPCPNIDTLIAYGGKASFNIGSIITRNFPWIVGDYISAINGWNENGLIYYGSHSDSALTMQTGIIWVEYTKTTDIGD